MKKLVRTILCLATLLTIGAQDSVEGRVGTFDIGPGCKAKGMGGVAVALPQDSLVGAINPAGCVWVCDRFDLGAQVLSAPRIYTHSNALVFVPGTGFVQLQPSKEKLRGYPQCLFLPEGGINYMLDDCSCLSAAFYIGGGSTEYKHTNPIAAGGHPNLYSHRCGLILGQYFGALSYSRWINPNHSLGVSLVLVEQTLTVRGLQGFDSATGSVAPGHVTNRNIDYSFGAGFRIGWIGKIWNNLTGGASYTTRMACQRFDKYKGIVTQKGRLEVPAILAAGFTWDWSCLSRLSFEWQRLFYSDCKLWGNSFNRYIGAIGGTQKSGAGEGPGFGWRNLDVYKVGADYKYNRMLTLRGGYCLSKVPYNNQQLDVNILTENIGRHHLTLGFTYALNPLEEIDFSYFHMFRTRVSGPSQLRNSLGTLTQRMYQDSVEISYGRKF